MPVAARGRVRRMLIVWFWLVIGGVASAGAADAPEQALDITTVNGNSFAWPSLAAPEYAGAQAQPLREALAHWKEGGRPRGLPRQPRADAELYLAADLWFLNASAG